MKNSKLSVKSFIKQLNSKKYLKNKESILSEGIRIYKEDFNIENVDYIESLEDTDNKVDNIIAHENLKHLLDSTSSCQISDALGKLTGRNGVLKDIKSINGKRAYGRVVTSKTNSDDWGTSLLAIDQAKKGNVIFILSSGESSAIWGELTSTCSSKKGLAGTVIVGATRDIDLLLGSDYPVFATETVPNAGNPIGLGDVNVNLRIQEDMVRPGDFVFADNTGVVLIPQELFQEVMIETLKIKISESKIISQIKDGKPLSKIIGLR
ncbi:putative regulator of ribonuclease activity [Methanobrevibacter cuticularis]|uniref:Putative regulator of ribonuclease activity n=1 Tax=Methanobrevibacter cuticularis TaxID=47311 RepID=A0A166CZ71_9EURY|nr:hypothetical protein [Methanobrevibacter cuticularis]KZX15023.1 putative regulator of ribonuclease activity [Methanobrevibacter cuticularis]